jgi:hypothetical protein
MGACCRNVYQDCFDRFDFHDGFPLIGGGRTGGRVAGSGGYPNLFGP